MGCFLSCFRFKPEQKRKSKDPIKSSPVPNKERESLVANDHLSSVFISIGSPGVNLNSEGSGDENVLEKELRNEAEFLKSCGALLKAPAEFCNSAALDQDDTPSYILENLPRRFSGQFLNDKQQEDSECRHLISAGSCCFEGHVGQKMVHENPVCSDGVHHDSVIGSGYDYAAVDASSCEGVNDDHVHEPVLDAKLDSVSPIERDMESVKHDHVLNSASDSVSEASDPHPDYIVDSVLASVHNSAAVGVSHLQVDTEEGMHSHRVLNLEPGFSAVDGSPGQVSIKMNPLCPNNSPYPTPLKLTDDMETPGTIFPSNQKNLRKKHLRTKYAYPVLTPVENLSRWMVPRDGREFENMEQNTAAYSSIRDKRCSVVEIFEKENYGSVKRLRSTTPLSSCKGGRAMFCSENQRMKPPLANNNNNADGFNDSVEIRDLHVERTPDGARPVLASNEDEAFHITPKLWGGNCIPNTTTKYKEDQKVTWHATPFEQRLDKALAENKLFPERNINNRKLVRFEDEGAVSDTEILQSS